MKRSTVPTPATVQVATGQAAPNVARHAGHAHTANSPQPPHVDGAFWLAHPAAGVAHGCPLRSLLKRAPSTQEVKLAYMVLAPALAKDIDEISFVRRLEGKPEKTVTPTQAVMPTELLTLSEYSARAKRSRSSVYTDMDEGRIPYVSVGRRARRIPAAFLAQLEARAFALEAAAAEETFTTEPTSSVTSTDQADGGRV